MNWFRLLNPRCFSIIWLFFGWMQVQAFSRLQRLTPNQAFGGCSYAANKIQPLVTLYADSRKLMVNRDIMFEASSIDPALSSEDDSLLETVRRPSKGLSISFSHIHLFVDKLETLTVYRGLEERLNRFHAEASSLGIEEKRQFWEKLNGSEAHDFVPQNRDLVKQLMVGLGFRITGRHPSPDVKPDAPTSLLLTSRDQNGVQVVVTAPTRNQPEMTTSKYAHFDPDYHREYFLEHAGRQGIAVLGFNVEDMESIYRRYQQLHPDLFHSYEEHIQQDGSKTRILQVFAYYKNSHDTGKCADRGTILRFIENDPSRSGTASCACPLPGLDFVDSTFDNVSKPAYCDHWVSNVYSRTDFSKTLEDILGFGAKVDFNAGVVAAGEAQIESTVIGNTSPFETDDIKKILIDQSQVFLPINNALSEVGHVHGFLKEMGQGIQHCASRVNDLVSFVELCNDMREITGEGFNFLDIPRSYYGILTIDHLISVAGISENLSRLILAFCERNGIVSNDAAVDLSLNLEDVTQAFNDAKLLHENHTEDEFEEKKEEIFRAILSSRYCNTYALLKDTISEEQYLGVVRNRILVDVQGSDILYQIFTCNILQRMPGEEAPFLEFIQRVCSPSTSKIKPGCGGFGIRNFLTLFLSIEVSKATTEVAEAKVKGDKQTLLHAELRVNCFKDQLEESNPILNRISDAMAEEGECKGNLETAIGRGNITEASIWQERLAVASRKKEEASTRLLECSARYAKLMKGIRVASESKSVQ